MNNTAHPNQINSFSFLSLIQQNRIVLDACDNLQFVFQFYKSLKLGLGIRGQAPNPPNI